MSLNIFPTLDGAQIEVERRMEFDTIVQREAGGRELRLARQSSPVYRYRISYNFLRQDSAVDEAATLQGFFLANSGAWDSFLYLDPYDSTVTAQEFGTGDAATQAFRLQRTLGGVVSDVLGTWPVYSTSRVNLVTRSAEFGHGDWIATATSYTSNAVMAPDGSGLSADKLTETAVTSGHNILQPPTLITGTYTLSVYAKAAERTAIQLNIGADWVKFNLSIGAVDSVSGATGVITSVGNGWYRCAATAATTTGETVVISLLDGSLNVSYLGIAASGVYLWGAQMEAGSTATRYIATTSAIGRERPSFWPGGTSGYEPIFAPAWASVLIYNAGVATTAWTASSPGIVTFGSAPASGNELSWSGSFYRRCRFDGDSFQIDRRHSRVWKASVDLISLIG